MQDKFWTPELWCEFLNSNPGLPATFQNEVNLFKSSKSPKKEWEIVAFEETHCDEKFYYLLCSDGKYRRDGQMDKVPYSAYQFKEESRERIFSVRRLSDGEVFSVGDRINGGIIQKIDTTTSSMDGIMFRTADVSKPISCAERLPQAILITIDGVDIFPGDEYYFIDAGWEIRFTGDNYNWVSENIKAFADKEEAILYVQENKPLLSLNDVKEVCSVPGMRVSAQTDILIEKLTALARQKLNQ